MEEVRKLEMISPLQSTLTNLPAEAQQHSPPLHQYAYPKRNDHLP